MLIRRHRATPEVDERFKLKPHETMDPAFTDPNLTNAEAKQVKDVTETQAERVGDDDLGPLSGPGEVTDDPGPTVENLFDPSLHNAEEVLEHAAALDAEGLEALSRAETAGKARKGVLEALAKFSAEKEQEEEPGTPGDTEAPDPGEDPSKDNEGLF